MYAVKSATEYRQLGIFDVPEDGEVLMTIEEFLVRYQPWDESLDLELKYP